MDEETKDLTTNEDNKESKEEKQNDTQTQQTKVSDNTELFKNLGVTSETEKE